MKNRHKITILWPAALAIIFLIAVLPSPPPTTLENPARMGEVHPAQAALDNDKIYLTGNSAVDAFCTLGSGIAGDPYIIENFNINSSGDAGILITQCDVHIEIRNCTIIGNSSLASAGILLIQASNVIISGNRISDQNIGISIDNSADTTIVDNDCWDCLGYNIYLFGCDGASILDNTCTGSTRGIFLISSNSPEISGNTAFNCDYGIYLDHCDSAVISENDLTGTFLANYAGIFLTYSDLASLTGNTCSNFTYGIDLYPQGNTNNLTSNILNENWCGLRLVNSYSNQITANELSYNTVGGIRLESICSYNTFDGNVITGNGGDGLQIIDSDLNYFTDNHIAGNGNGLRLVGSGSNEIWLNKFVNNLGYQASPYEEVVENMWDNGSLGNYWSDFADKYPSALVQSDGLVWDRRYIVGSFNYDRYPLASESATAEDSDGDGIYDAIEMYNYGSDPLLADTDSDGLTDSEEVAAGTDLSSPDTDGDSMFDKWELDHGLDPLAFDAWGDPDGDGLTNLAEMLGGTDPQVADAGDHDDDGNGDERGIPGYNPLLFAALTFLGIWFLLKKSGRITR